MAVIPEPTMKRMICKPNHSHRGKRCKVGQIVEDTPHYIRLLESQKVTVWPGYEDMFLTALEQNEGDHVKALEEVQQKQVAADLAD